MNQIDILSPPSDIDGLRLALGSPNLSVTTRANWLCELARLLARVGLTEESLKHAKEAIELAETHALPSQKANGLDAASVCHYYRGDHLMAIACGIDAYQGFAEQNEYAKMGHVLTSVAASFAKVEAIDLAEETLRSCLNIAVRLGDDFLLARTQNTLGITLGDSGRFDEAEPFLNAAIVNYQRLGKSENIPEIMGAHGNLLKQHAKHLTAEKDIEGAKQFLRRGIVMVRQGLDDAIACDHQYQIATQAGALGEYYFLLGEFALAETHFDVALARGRVLNHASLMAETMLYLGRIAQENGNYADAIQWLRKGLTLTKERELKALRPALHEAISSVLKKMGETADADAHADIARELRRNLSASHREIAREARAMWLSHFSRHPMITSS